MSDAQNCGRTQVFSEGATIYCQNCNDTFFSGIDGPSFTHIRACPMIQNPSKQRIFCTLPVCRKRVG